jgi:hypothetical protein
VCFNNARRQDANLVVALEHVEMVNTIAETVLVPANFCRRRNRKVKRPAALVLVADRFHAHFRDRFPNRFGVGQTSLVLDFEDHGRSAYAPLDEGYFCLENLASMQRIPLLQRSAHVTATPLKAAQESV